MKLHRFIITSLLTLCVFIPLYAFIESWSEDWMPQDPPLPFFGAAVMWGIRLALWPLCIYGVLFERDPSGLAFAFLLLAAAGFWGFTCELACYILASRHRHKTLGRM